LEKGIAVFGEVGLAGEIRPCPRGQDRIREAAKLGYQRLIVPKANLPKAAIEGLQIVGVDRLDQAIEVLWTG
jgi:DNA repair protein RadA/Sms